MKNCIKILLVASNPKAIEHYQDLLIGAYQQDFDITTTESPENLLSLVAEEVYDCFLVEQLFYDRVGNEFFAKIKQKTTQQLQPYIVMVTALQQSPWIDQIPQNTYTSFLKTDISAEKLQHVIQDACGEEVTEHFLQRYYFSEVFTEKEQQQLKTVHELEGAISRKELYLRYQPIFDLHSRNILAHEVLLRWNHPTMDIIGPKEFIPLAERSGLMGPVGRWIITSSCNDAATWRKISIVPQQVLIKFTNSQLQDEGIGAWLQKILETVQIEPNHLIIEVSETQIISDVPAYSKILHQLHEMGFQICIQNIGSYALDPFYLDEMPKALLKLSPLMSREMSTNPTVRRQLKTLIQKCTRKGYHVIATGIEQEDQLKEIAAMGCSYAQGYYLCLPLKARGIGHLLNDINRISIAKRK